MFTLIVFLFCLGMYFVPSFVAHGRQHHQQSAIMVLNFFLGWTLIGWVAALIWAATEVRKPSQGVQPQ